MCENCLTVSDHKRALLLLNGKLKYSTNVKWWSHNFFLMRSFVNRSSKRKVLFKNEISGS